MDHTVKGTSKDLSPIARRYLRAVRRELCLRGQERKAAFKSLRQQLEGVDCSYSDFISRFGSPLHSAEILNHSIPGYVYDKSDFRIPCLLVGMAGSLLVLYRLVTELLFRFLASTLLSAQVLGFSDSVGIIGGADGPTAVFVTSTPFATSDLTTVLGLALALAGFLGFYFLRYRKRKLRQ